MALVVFNYDRCIEFYLLHTLQHFYKIEASKAISLLKNIEIYHPYGMVGALPDWPDAGAAAIPFGAEAYPEKLIDISKALKTFTQGVDTASSHIQRIRELMRTGRSLVFLGFAYHRLNLKLLFDKPSGLPALNARQIFGTAKGLSSSDCANVSKELSEYAETELQSVHVNHALTCNQLFQEYSRALSFN